MLTQMQPASVMSKASAFNHVRRGVCTPWSSYFPGLLKVSFGEKVGKIPGQYPVVAGERRTPLSFD